MLLSTPQQNLDGPSVIEFIPCNNKKRTFSLWEQESKPLTEGTLEQLIEEEWLPEPGFLRAKNPHPKDSYIKLYEENHTYEVRYRDTNVTFDNISISTLAHRYFPDFDADKRIQKIRANWKFSRNRYGGLTDEEIKTEWEENRQMCSRQGTFYHRLFENACNGFDLGNSKFSHLLPVKQYLKWRKDFFNPQFEEFRTELRMFSTEDLRIVGTADLIAVRKNHPPPNQCHGVLHLSIFDWKNTKNLDKKEKEKGFGPCSHLDNSKLNIYFIQQNLYKYLLEHFYSHWMYNDKPYTAVKVDMMQLIVVHDNHFDREAHRIVVPDMTPLIEEMIRLRKEELRSPHYIPLPD